jgi:hypothetical protein
MSMGRSTGRIDHSSAEATRESWPVHRAHNRLDDIVGDRRFTISAGLILE